MFLANVLTALDQGVKRAFDDTYQVEEFRNLYTSIDFPADEARYPAVWVDFEPRGTLSIAGINHREYVVDEDKFGEVTRWRFEGQAMFTLVSLTSWARAKLMDEMIKVIGFGALENKGAFRQWIDDNEVVAMNLSYDEIGVRGMSSSKGTPWGTDSILYEVTLVVNAIGEFVSTATGQLVPLSEIRVFDWVEGEPDPVPDLHIAGPEPYSSIT